MPIVLVITDTKGRNRVFVTDTLKAFKLQEALQQAKQGNLPSLHIVRTGPGAYLRGNPNTSAADNLDHLSVSAHQFFAMLDNSSLLKSLYGFKRYWQYYAAFLKTLEELGEEIIIVDSIPRTTKASVRSKLTPHRQLIFAAAKYFSIDPCTLGAIIIDEIVRMAPFESISDALLPDVLSFNVSVGIAQVKLETARGLIKSGYYNPNPKDKKLSKEEIGSTPQSTLYEYVVQPKHCIYFSAAAIKNLIDQWSLVLDISDRPEIIGTLYHQPPMKPNLHPGPDERGAQIASEFYPFAKSILET